MSREDKIRQFDPNGVGLKNGHFIGLPFTEEEAQIVLLSVPWDVTVSYSDGTSRGPENILQASTQLDLYDPEAPDAWKMGLYLRPPDTEWQHRNDLLRSKAKEYLAFLEGVETSIKRRNGKSCPTRSPDTARNWSPGCRRKLRPYWRPGNASASWVASTAYPLAFLELCRKYTTPSASCRSTHTWT